VKENDAFLRKVLGLMGIGRMWSPKTGWGSASDVLEQNGLSLIEYKPKEVREIKIFFSSNLNI
jgi:hypothetical protein